MPITFEFRKKSLSFVNFFQYFCPSNFISHSPWSGYSLALKVKACETKSFKIKIPCMHDLSREWFLRLVISTRMFSVWGVWVGFPFIVPASLSGSILDFTRVPWHYTFAKVASVIVSTKAYFMLQVLTDYVQNNVTDLFKSVAVGNFSFFLPDAMLHTVKVSLNFRTLYSTSFSQDKDSCRSHQLSKLLSKAFRIAKIRWDTGIIKTRRLYFSKWCYKNSNSYNISHKSLRDFSYQKTSTSKGESY